MCRAARNKVHDVRPGARRAGVRRTIVHEKRVGFRDTIHPPRTGAGKMRGEESVGDGKCILPIDVLTLSR